MLITKEPPKNIDEYIAMVPEHVQEILIKLRDTIRKAAPEAEEVISYGMPAFKFKGAILVYFAAQKAHIGFYPTASGIENFKNELTPYQWSKGAVQFPLDKPLPYELINRMVAFRVQENLAKAEAKKKGASSGKGS
jgi:uncharacterized protein YdhG (YjbR/CyaY superfamily)